MLRIFLQRSVALCILYGLSYAALSQSVLSEGNWFKFSVKKEGVYRIDYNLLRAAGVNPDAIDPRKIKIYAGQYGMLPQSNAAARVSDLREVPLLITGEQDGKFNREDAIVFFAQGPDRIEFIPSKQIFAYENNLYSDQNFYFLTVAEEDGKRVVDAPSQTGNFPIVNSFHDFQVYENDKTNILSSGRDWFGELFDTNTEIRIGFDFPGIEPNTVIKVVSQVMAQANQPTSFKLFFNDIEATEQQVSAIPNSQYGDKGRTTRDTVTLLASAVNANGRAQQEIKFQYIKSPTVRSIGYLDYVNITCERVLQWRNEPLIFLNGHSVNQPISTFQIQLLPATARVWDVTDPFNIISQPLSDNNGTRQFSAATSTLRRFVAFDRVDAAPEFISKIDNQNLRGSSAVALLIITHSDFLAEAQRLAAHRNNHNQQSALVATVEQVYNEFSGGKPDVTAIRDFARHMYAKGELKNLLLFGKGSYDYKDRVVSNSNFVPIYESRNSLSPLETYASDDYFTFFDETEGEWRERPAQNHTMEIGVGRIPVRTAQQAKNIVDKLIAYDLEPRTWGDWRQRFLFVGDDGDFNIHQSQGNQLANEVLQTQPQVIAEKFFLSAFEQRRRPNGSQISPAGASALSRKIQSGYLVVNYTGHGSENILTEETLVGPTSTSQWKNRHRLPLLVTATCEFGRHDNPLAISTGENMLVEQNRGAIGLVTTSRIVNSSTNFIINRAFYDALFLKENGVFNTLGQVFRDTKNSSVSGVANRNFSLLGDPSMKLALPENDIVITSLQTTGGSDTLKSFASITLAGEIQTGNSLRTDFSGTATITLLDKLVTITTPGDPDEQKNPPSPPFTYSDEAGVLYKGQASVSNGAFSATFTMPAGLSNELAEGRLMLHAFDSNTGEQAAGAAAVNIGFSESITIDNVGPAITLFMGDTTYQPGGTVATNASFIATISDPQGINISGYGNGNLIITLDDSLTFIGNDFFVSDQDNFNAGVLTFPLFGLANGQHTISLRAADNHGNTSTALITFSVGRENELSVNSLLNYPNPFVSSTTFQFSHNRPGEDLQTFLSIYNSTGQLIYGAENVVSESLYTVTLGEWNLAEQTSNLPPGIYFARLIVRSLLDGAKNEKITKLIVVN